MTSRSGDLDMNQRRVAIAVVLGSIVLVGVALAYRGLTSHGFSAREKPWAIEEFVARRLRALATDSEAKDMINPFTPNPQILADARDHFADHCALCHAEDGSGKTEIGEGMYPPASNLRARETQQLTDGELFQVIRNGIRFTGMPGWGGSDTDDEIWQLVVFIRALPDSPPAKHGEGHRH